MKKISLLLISMAIVIVGCNGKEQPVEQTFNPRVSPSEIYTFYGFYEGFGLTYEEQQVVDSGIIHISQSYLIPTQEYSLREYPLKGTQALNPYLENNKEEIKEFMVKKYQEQTFGALTINVRDDRVFDYQFISSGNKENDSSILTFRYEVVGQEAKSNYYEDFYINSDLLLTKDENDEFDESIFYPDSDNEGKWYTPNLVSIAADNHLSKELSKYYSEDVDEINDYIDSTGKYQNVDREEKCLIGNECKYEGNVQLYIITEEFSHELGLYFLENNMTVEEIIDYIDENNYRIGIIITPFISKEIYDEYDFEKYYGKSRNEGEEDEWDYVMNNVLDDYSDDFIEDKNTLKNIIGNSSMDVSEVMFSVSVGYALPTDDVYGMSYVNNVPITYNYEKYSTLDDDLFFVKLENEDKQARFFVWDYNLEDNDE